MHYTPLSLKVVVVALSLVSVLVQARRLAASRGNPRIFRVAVVSVLLSCVLVAGIVYHRLHLRPQPSTAENAAAG